MSGPSFQPPVHLDPTQDPAQQTAFINQNFQTLATALETNGFRIVLGPLTVPIPSSATATSQVTVTHNLQFVPTCVCAIDLFGDGTDVVPMPLITVNSATGAVTFVAQVVQLTSTTVQFRVVNVGSTVAAGSNITYYLLQQPAN